MNTKALPILLLALVTMPAFAGPPPLPRGTEILVGTVGFSPSVAVFEDGRFVVVWDGGPGIVARFFDRQGKPTSGELPLKAVGHVNQVVADLDGTFLVVSTSFTNSSNVYVRRFNPNGTPRGKTIRANAPSTSDRYEPVATIGPDGRFAVAWRADVPVPGREGEGWADAVARIFSAKGIPLTPEILLLRSSPASPAGDDGDHSFPNSLALAPDGTLSALVHRWPNCIRNFLVRVPPGGGSPGVKDLSGGSCSSTLGSGDGSLTMGKDGSLVAAWKDVEMHAQRFAKDGTPREERLPVTEEWAYTQADPQVVLQAGGSFVVVWTEGDGRDGDLQGIFGRAFNPRGTPRTQDFLINVTTVGDQHDPAIAAARRGPVVVVWSGPGGIFARVLSANP
jgi:hypothetical protein